MKIQIGGTGTLLTIIFFVAKILGYIDWSYWWVFAPIWIPIMLILAFVGFCLSMAVLKAILE